MTASEFTHLDPLGRARMVDVTAKEPSHRRAVARCRIYMAPATAGKIASGAVTKGDVLAVARVAGRSWGDGEGNSKKEAEQRAAEAAWGAIRAEVNERIAASADTPVEPDETD